MRRRVEEKKLSAIVRGAPMPLFCVVNIMWQLAKGKIIKR
jgi:hypothetical protein